LLRNFQAEENRLRKEEELRMKREEESKKDEEKMRKKEEEKARREAILQQFKLKKELENNDDVSYILETYKPVVS
jgi:calmodulin-regulated spectrin-associated protein